MTSVQTILHPTDFSRCADKAFQTACSLARGGGAQVIILHVLEPVRLSVEWLTRRHFRPPKADRWESLRRLRIREPGVWIELVMRRGDPAAVILDLAQEVPCDAIVMGMRGHAAEDSPGLGTVAAEVVRRAPCPVMGVKPSPRGAGGPNAARRCPAAVRPGSGWERYRERVPCDYQQKMDRIGW